MADPVSNLVNAGWQALNLPAAFYTYSKQRPFTLPIFGSAHFYGDCSAFCIALFQAAGWDDPSGNGFDGYGFTGDMWQHGIAQDHPDPGFLAFWQNPDHVALVLDGAGTIVEFGGPPAPIQFTASGENSYHASFQGFYSFTHLAGGSIPAAPPDEGVPVADYDPSPIIRNGFWQFGVHGLRSYDNANRVWDYVRNITYCTEDGPGG